MTKYSPEKRIRKFWAKVAVGWPDECWLWQASTYTNGYGTFWNGERCVGAHVFAYLLTRKLQQGQEVCHTCDNHACCNPKHLFAGTHKENIKDMFKKGRANKAFGTRNHSKLNENDIVAIRSDTRSLRTIAKDYGVHCTVIHHIKKRNTWRHVI